MFIFYVPNNSRNQQLNYKANIARTYNTLKQKRLKL